MSAYPSGPVRARRTPRNARSVAQGAAPPRIGRLALSAALILLLGASAAVAERAESVLRLQDVDKTVSGNVLTVTGTLVNEGQGAIPSVSISVAALDDESERVGGRVETLNEAIPPRQSRHFSLRVDIEAHPTAIQVYVSAPVDRVIIDN